MTYWDLKKSYTYKCLRNSKVELIIKKNITAYFKIIFCPLFSKAANKSIQNALYNVFNVKIYIGLLWNRDGMYFTCLYISGYYIHYNYQYLLFFKLLQIYPAFKIILFYSVVIYLINKIDSQL